MSIISNEELCRWAALFECLYIIEQFCDKQEVSFEDMAGRCLKPVHIRKYIEDRTPEIEEMVALDKVNSDKSDFITKFIYD